MYVYVVVRDLPRGRAWAPGPIYFAAPLSDLAITPRQKHLRAIYPDASGVSLIGRTSINFLAIYNVLRDSCTITLARAIIELTVYTIRQIQS